MMSSPLASDLRCVGREACFTLVGVVRRGLSWAGLRARSSAVVLPGPLGVPVPVRALGERRRDPAVLANAPVPLLGGMPQSLREFVDKHGTNSFNGSRTPQ